MEQSLFSLIDLLRGVPRPFATWGGWLLAMLLLCNAVLMVVVLRQATPVMKRFMELLGSVADLLAMSKEDRYIIGEVKKLVDQSAKDVLHETRQIQQAAATIVKATQDSGKLPIPPIAPPEKP